MKAAEATHCAGDQGKYWEMHNRLFTNQRELSRPDLTKHAQALGLAAAEFATCLDSGRFADAVEADFRAGEVRVIARLLKDADLVLGTGGGAFMNTDTRSLVKQAAISVWIKADFELLFQRVQRRSNRPLLKTEDPTATVSRLL